METENTGQRRCHSFLLILTALIWGTAFTAQSAGGDTAGPYTFNCIRSIIGAAVLLPVIRLSDRRQLTRRRPAGREDRRMLLTGGIACGTALAAASNLQQMGIYLGAAAGKAGFLTACYMLIVPVLGLFLHKKCSWNVWAGIAAAVAGLYLLCIKGDFRIQFSDLLLLLCAFVFAIHILVIDYFAVRVDGVRMSCIQFLVCGVITAVPMYAIDIRQLYAADGIAAWAAVLMQPDAWIPILYAGVLSCGAGYTLQIIGAAGCESHGGVTTSQSGIRIFRAGRLGSLRRSAAGKRDCGMCADIWSSDFCTASYGAADAQRIEGLIRRYFVPSVI